MAVTTKNVGGTNMPTFKFRSGSGIELISAAIKDEVKKGYVRSKFRVKDETGVHDVAYYDTHIASEEIRNIKYVTNSNGTSEIVLVLKELDTNGHPIEINLSRFINTSVLDSLIVAPKDADEGEITIYGGSRTDGKTELKKSGKSFVDDNEYMENGSINMEKFDALKLENQICFPLYAASREVVKRYRPFLDEINLTYTQYIVMMVLWEDKKISVKELGKKLYLDSGTLSPVLKSLEAKGFVTRKRSMQDERVLIAEITEAGMAVQKEAAHVPGEVNKFVNISAEESKQLYELLYKVLVSLAD
jgi:DNA-binding MarR family transcriptional regulator